ncbi:hypothetical protein ACFVW2_09115 [Streptomyces sp. NPDC058171]
MTPHPVWAGVDFDELLYRTGVPGTPTGEELARVGVAGFYGRGYHGALPEDATVINGIGPYRLPIDIGYPLGAGAVLAHAGNDLLSFSDHDRTTRHLGARLLDWLEGPRLAPGPPDWASSTEAAPSSSPPSTTPRCASGDRAPTTCPSSPRVTSRTWTSSSSATGCTAPDSPLPHPRSSPSQNAAAR